MFFFLTRVSTLTRSNSKKFWSSLCAFLPERAELSRGQFDFKLTSQLVLGVGQSADWELWIRRETRFYWKDLIFLPWSFPRREILFDEGFKPNEGKVEHYFGNNRWCEYKWLLTFDRNIISYLKGELIYCGRCKKCICKIEYLTI